MRALCGPISPFDEQPKNSEARNTMFELSLAADWKNAGSEVELGEPDIKLRAPAALFQTECKRPFSENSVRKNIEDAASQLGKELNRHGTGRVSIRNVGTPQVRREINNSLLWRAEDNALPFVSVSSPCERLACGSPAENCRRKGYRRRG